jgi:hypothetical protein
MNFVVATCKVKKPNRVTTLRGDFKVEVANIKHFFRHNKLAEADSKRGSLAFLWNRSLKKLGYINSQKKKRRYDDKEKRNRMELRKQLCQSAEIIFLQPQSTPCTFTEVDHPK